MRQVRLLTLVGFFFASATSLFAEEARRAEPVNPPKKSAPEIAARALPVTTADKKEAAVPPKKEVPSVEIDLGSKKETQVAKKDVSAPDKKEVVSVPTAKKEIVVAKKDVVPPATKEITATSKKEISVPVKKDVGAADKKDVASVPTAKKETVVAKKDVVPPATKEIATISKKEISVATKKDLAPVEKKEITAAAKKDAAVVSKKEISQPVLAAVAEKKDATPDAKKEFTFKDANGKSVSAEVVDQYQNKRIVYPLAKVDHRINAKLVRAASIAQDRARAHSKSACWHYVKNALLASGIISTYPKSVYAKQAGEELVRDYGFKKLPIHDPYQAPIGAVLVYGSRRAAGHVELRTKTGFVSDFQNKKPSKRPLIGVYAKA